MISAIYSVFQGSLTQYPLLDKRYRLLMTIGEGRHAKVKLAKDEKTNRFVAAKLLHKSFTELELNLLHNEVRALLRLNEYSNRHIQGILDFNFYGEIRFHPNGIAKTAYFIMPVEEHGEFYNIVEKTHGFSESMARIFFRDLLESIEFVHSRNIGHRDIKTENLLLTEDFKLKLCDFGSSCTLMKSGKDDIVTPTEAVGSPEYNAPELHTGEAGTSESAIKAADIFSLGCVLFLMVVNCLPFRVASPSDPYYSRLISCNSGTFWKLFHKACPNLTPEFKDLFERMTRRYPEDRISLMEIKKHPWVNQFIDPAENFVKIMSERVEIVSKPIKAEALKVSDKSSHSKAEFSCKSENCNIPDPLKKLMLEYKQKTKKTRKECLNLVHTSSKSSSQDESGVCESDEKPRKIKPVSLNQMANKPPFNPKRSDEDSWSSFSENEDQHQY